MAGRRGSEPANYVARLSEWADAHLSLLRTTKFTNALEIPIEFIEKNVKLRGRLHQITEQGLEIEHVPIILPIISSLQRRWHTDGLLLVRLAGVELTPEGAMWLKKELKPSQMMWFQLLRRQEVTLDCRVVVSKGRFSSLCLNEEILRQGLGRAVPVEGLSHKSRIYWKLHKGLLQAELKAVKRNRGIWKEATFLEKLREHVNNNKYIQKLKQFATWLRIRP
ncbi:protein C3orf33 homolog isoform X2 [Paroedura picta]|uniref:protein C3orf33 homolog isoform X2 n=1 Tax=Paroedura picta TaxID=143630 RepID=UPI004056D0C3